MWRLLVIIAAGYSVLGTEPILQSATNYFLVAEWPGRVVHNDSFVIALTNAQQIVHARDLIARGPATAGAPIVFANIAPGADGLNRDLRRTDARSWSWHVTQVQGFGDFGAELYDGWPSYVESNVAGWISNTGGKIGFWSYTVVAELPLSPRVQISRQHDNRIALSLTNLTPPFPVTIEMVTSLPASTWLAQTNFSPATLSTNLVLPIQETRAFYRVRTP